MKRLDSWGYSDWRREGTWKTLENLPVPKQGYQTAVEGLFVGLCSDRTRGNDIKLKGVDLDYALGRNYLL